MKKALLALAAMGIGAGAINAQTRLSLYEEFSGENCGPCALYNPGLWNLMTQNTSKILLIKYQSPIPSAGPIYNLYPTQTYSRMVYYGVSSAPFGYQNGNEVTGNIANYNQTAIDASVANAAPFAVTVTHAYNAAGDSVTATVNVTSTNAFAPSGAVMKLRVAFIEHLEYCSAPGTNGESEFHNVVREMYPNAAGSAIPNSWTANESHTYTIKGRVPSFVDLSNKDARMVVWIQDDATKNIAQAAVSTHVNLPVDASLKSCPAVQLSCATSSVNVAPTVTITNTGANALTSATIYYRLNTGAWASTPWTGNIASGANATVTLPSISMPVGTNVVMDSVAMPNGQADANVGNNTITQRVVIRNSTVEALPVGSDFEAGTPYGWVFHDQNGNNENWATRSGVGHDASSRSVFHYNYAYSNGEQNTILMPNVRMTPGAKSLDFWYAYAQYSTENDKLDVVYSTDCGGNWTSLWSASGANLATRSAVSSAAYVPASADWRKKVIDVSAVPDSAIIGFRATSDYGNNLFLDDVNVQRDWQLSVNETIVQGSVSVYPNPTRDAAQLEFALNEAGKVSVVVYDAVGRVVATPFEGTMAQGTQRVKIATGGLAVGMYSINLVTEAGKVTQRLSVVK